MWELTKKDASFVWEDKHNHIAFGGFSQELLAKQWQIQAVSLYIQRPQPAGDCQQFSHNTLLEEISDKSLHNIMLADLSFLLSSSIPGLKGEALAIYIVLAVEQL